MKLSNITEIFEITKDSPEEEEDKIIDKQENAVEADIVHHAACLCLLRAYKYGIRVCMYRGFCASSCLVWYVPRVQHTALNSGFVRPKTVFKEIFNNKKLM
jgi:hypothetical protein